MQKLLTTAIGVAFCLVVAWPFLILLPPDVGLPLFEMIGYSLLVIVPMGLFTVTGLCWKIFFDSIDGTSTLFQDVASTRTARILGLLTLLPAFLFSILCLVSVALLWHELESHLVATVNSASSNRSIDADFISTGFAGLLSAGHLRR